MQQILACSSKVKTILLQIYVLTIKLWSKAIIRVWKICCNNSPKIHHIGTYSIQIMTKNPDNFNKKMQLHLHQKITDMETWMI